MGNRNLCVGISISSSALTHVQLANKTGHVVVFVVEGQLLAGELCLVLDDEAPAILKRVIR